MPFSRPVGDFNLCQAARGRIDPQGLRPRAPRIHVHAEAISVYGTFQALRAGYARGLPVKERHEVQGLHRRREDAQDVLR